MILISGSVPRMDSQIGPPLIGPLPWHATTRLEGATDIGTKVAGYDVHEVWTSIEEKTRFDSPRDQMLDGQRKLLDDLAHFLGTRFRLVSPPQK